MANNSGTKVEFSVKDGKREWTWERTFHEDTTWTIRKAIHIHLTRICLRYDLKLEDIKYKIC